MTGAIRVVLCDDAAMVRELTRHGLEEDQRLEVIAEADDAAAGVECASELRPDAVLLDISMPGMGGLEAIPLIRAASPETAIVVFSGFSAERLESKALELGAARYVQKGVDFEVLRRAVFDACGEFGVRR